ncbi:MAG: hypothetical protein A3K83_05625 [Omnitrophica WOR_2 bacterium RBG_13_44_8b]|nr:MAG: hypothetical protein A3K83_05625 [Omnitrophica WOR_2 bacterium RBG_13_44_8b]
MGLKISFFSIALFLHSFSRYPAQATETFRTDNVLVSRENKSSAFFIRQDTCQAGAVLVSTPNHTDLRIIDLLNANGIRTLKDYMQWLAENIKYKGDEGVDAWAMPEETLNRQYGDCEDFAFLNAAVLSVLGYRTKVLGLHGVRTSKGQVGNHAICLLEEGGNYLYFDNEKLKPTGASTLDEFCRYIFSHYYCNTILELKTRLKPALKFLTILK